MYQVLPGGQEAGQSTCVLQVGKAQLGSLKLLAWG